jgi:restriction system protein
MSFFSIKSNSEEFRNALDGKDHVAPVISDPSVAQIASDVEEQTRDYILKALAQGLKGHPFEDFVAHLLQSMGYRTRQPRRGKGADGGIDVIAHRDELGLEPPIVKVQVKSREGSTGDPEVTALYGKCGDDEYALFVTLGEFTAQAEAFARNNANLRLVNGVDLVNLIFAHYEKFDSRHKGLIPLKRVYIPDPD